MSRSRDRRCLLGGRAFTSVLILLVALLPMAKAYGTTTVCAGPRTPCEKYANASRIFVGRVTSLVRDSTISTRWAWHSTFVIEKRYKGPPMDSVMIRDGDRYSVGESYLVFADSLLRTSWCSGTEKYNEHSANTRFLEGLPGSLSSRSIWGTVSRETTYFDLRSIPAPEPGVTVRSVSKSASFETVTDGFGHYAFTDLPADSYRVVVEPPAGYVDDWYWCPHDVNLSTQMCDVVDMTLTPDGWITGSVVDSSGKPIPNIRISARPVNPLLDPNVYSTGLEGRTDEDGYYCIRGIPPGSYYIGSNLTELPSGTQPYDAVYFPGVQSQSLATHVDVGPGERKEPLNFSIERTYPIILIAGTVRYSNGLIPRAASVDFCDSAAWSGKTRHLSFANADSMGRFILPVIAGQTGWALSYAAMWRDPFMNGYVAGKPMPVFIDPAAADSPLTLTIVVSKK